MIDKTWHALGLSLLLAAGCDRETPAPPGPGPTPAVPTTEPVRPTHPVPPAVPPPSQAQAAAVAASSSQGAAQPQRRPASPTKELVREERIQVSSLELDLSLPEDWAAELVPEPMTPRPLLPPLFGAREPDSVGLSGRLISGQQPDDPLIQGAEVQFEFRR